MIQTITITNTDGTSAVYDLVPSVVTPTVTPEVPETVETPVVETPDTTDAVTPVEVTQ